jgi:thioredoxin reductase (NADPH)
MEPLHDLIVVGGGIAGMTAAIYAARANLDVLVLEKEICGGLANYTYAIENFPSYPSINGMELMQKIKDHVASLGVRIEEIIEVTGVQFTHDHKEIATLEKSFSAKSAILATGRVPIKLPIESE